MKRLLSAFLAVALFLSFSTVAFAVWPYDDLSYWEDNYDKVLVDSFDLNSFSIILGNTSGSVSPSHFMLSSSSNKINNQVPTSAGSSVYCDLLQVDITSSVSLTAGKLYFISFSVSFDSGFNSSTFAHEGFFSYVPGVDLLASKITGGLNVPPSITKLTAINGNLIVDASSTSVPSFTITIDDLNILVNQNTHFTATVTGNIYELQEPQLSIEEWLEKIFDEIEGQDDQLQQDAGEAVPDDFQQQQGEASEQLQEYEQAEQQFTTDLNDSLTTINPEQYSIPTGIVAAMSWINGYVVQGFTGLGDYNIILFLPMVLGLALAVIGRFGRVISSRPTKSSGGGGDPPNA